MSPELLLGRFGINTFESLSVSQNYWGFRGALAQKADHKQRISIPTPSPPPPPKKRPLRQELPTFRMQLFFACRWKLIIELLCLQLHLGVVLLTLEPSLLTSGTFYLQLKPVCLPWQSPS